MKKHLEPTEAMRDEWLALAHEHFYTISSCVMDDSCSPGPFRGGMPYEMTALKKIEGTENKWEYVGNFVDGREEGSHYDREKGKMVWGKHSEGIGWIHIRKSAYLETVDTMGRDQFNIVAEVLDLSIPDHCVTRTGIIEFMEGKAGHEKTKETLLELFEPPNGDNSGIIKW